MIFLFASILAINWAFYHPLQLGAHSLNSVVRHLGLISPHTQIDRSDAWYQNEPTWQKISDDTYCNIAAGIIMRDEVVIPGFSLESQRANFEARHPDAGQNSFRDNSLMTIHYYDLNWTLLTTDRYHYMPEVAARLDAAWSPWYDGERALTKLFEAYEAAGSTISEKSCRDVLPPPYPPPTFPRTK